MENLRTHKVEIDQNGWKGFVNVRVPKAHERLQMLKGAANLKSILDGQEIGSAQADAALMIVSVIGEKLQDYIVEMHLQKDDTVLTSYEDAQYYDVGIHICSACTDVLINGLSTKKK